MHSFVVLQYRSLEGKLHIWTGTTHCSLVSRYITQENERPNVYLYCAIVADIVICQESVDLTNGIIKPINALNCLHRSQVLAFKSSTQSHKFTCFADCSESMSWVSASLVIKNMLQHHTLTLSSAIWFITYSAIHDTRCPLRLSAGAVTV